MLKTLKLRLVYWSTRGPTWASASCPLVPQRSRMRLKAPVLSPDPGSLSGPPFCVCMKPQGAAPYHPVGNDVRVHPHLWVHADQVPPESLALQLFPQSLPRRDVPDVDPRVLHRYANAELPPPPGAAAPQTSPPGFLDTV